LENATLRSSVYVYKLTIQLFFQGQILVHTCEINGLTQLFENLNAWQVIKKDVKLFIPVVRLGIHKGRKKRWTWERHKSGYR